MTSLDLDHPFVPPTAVVEQAPAPAELPEADAAEADAPTADVSWRGAVATPDQADEVLAAAVDLARAAADADSVGEHLRVVAEPGYPGEHVATHAFASTAPGYTGWYWAVTVARAEGSDDVTVDEVVLLPGESALLAPTWVPWEERVRPGDLGPGDLLPIYEDDIRLVSGHLDNGDRQEQAVAFELGVGRKSVLSRDGRELAAERWYGGDRGPDNPMARQAPAACGTCGFMIALAGSLAAGFGVCANERTDTDGQVVSVEYGCGAHSAVKARPTNLAETTEIAFDDGEEITAQR